MELSADAAGWFAIFVLPVCFLVAWNDLARMKIPNVMVMALVAIYTVVGVFVLPFESFIWGFAHLVIALIVGIALNYVGAVGAGDAKFVAGAAPFVHLADLQVVFLIFCAALLAAFATHRIAKHSSFRKLVPHWESWQSGKRFPMGLALGMALAMYLILAAFPVPTA